MRQRFQKPTPIGWYLAIILSTAAVFIVDLQTALGVVTWIFYVIPLGACLFVSRPAMPFQTALVVSVLIYVDYVYSPDGVALWIAQINRVFAVIVIWAFAWQTHAAILDRRRRERAEWIRTAQLRLAERVVGEHSLPELGARVMNFIGEYLAAAAGVLYVREEGDSAVRIAGYAVPPEHPLRLSFGRGEGLIGQALASGKPMRVERASAGQLDATSALGAIQPREIIAQPLLADGEAIGVMEWSFHEALAPGDLELLAALSSPLGMALRTAQLRREREALLAATQQQAEQLQVQQEELRVTNEELEQQGAVLRESQARLEMQQAELEQSNSQLEEQTQMLEQHNEDLEAARRELLRKSGELARSNQFKSEFLANMSHELRTPLNSALILAKLLADNAQGNLTAEQVKFANNIYSAGNDLLELINDILDLSKIEARQIDVKRESVSLRALLDNTQQVFAPMAAQKQVAFDIELAADCPLEIHTDSQRLRQVLRNLLSNAMKFTLQGSVRLKVFRPESAPTAEEWIGFAVQDTGIGIAAEQQQLIFEPFRQADGTTNRRFGGTGLGLSISRELAALLGGRIELHSEPGVGSTFTLLLPQNLPDSAAAAPARSTPQATLTPGRRRVAPVRATKPAASPRVVQAVASDAPRRLLLIVEDDPNFAQTIAATAARLEFESLIAATADEGVQLALEHLPTAIALDINLPDHTGLTVLDRLKHDPSTRHIPVQIISGLDQTRAALQMGAASVLRKPVEREQLLAALEELDRRANSPERAVLIVEDNPVQRDSLQQLLQSEHVRVVAVGSAAEALEHLRSTTFDCMVLDLGLSDATGYEVLEKLAADESYSFPPVIVYTARALSPAEEQQLRRYSESIIIKGARSPERLVDEVTLFLHRVETSLPAEQQRLLRAARSRNAVFEQRRFLLAEDDVRNVFAITRVLESQGAALEIARNGREALAALERRDDIDLVLMDVMMPEMDGLEAMRAIRSNPRHANLPVIALTAKAMPDDRQKCLDAGASDYITKPIDIEKLLSLLRIWLPPRRGAA